ncbi:MAG: PAS domain S-box protein [Planctomycetota bacterium]|jgi:PAS domain S-box-containing protein
MIRKHLSITALTQRTWLMLLISIFIVFCSSVLRVAFFSGLGRGIPYLTYYPAIMIAAIIGGLPAGLLATFISAILAYVWIQQGQMTSIEWSAMAFFVAICVMISLLAEAKRRANQKVLRMKKSLEKLVQERTHELQKSEEHFRNLMEQSPLAMAIFTPDGQFTDVNPAWYHQWGLNREEATEVFARYNLRTDKQLEDLGVAPLVERAYAGESVVLPPIEYIGNRTLDEMEVEGAEARSCWIQIHLYPIKDENGSVTYVVNTNLDITDRMQAAKELKESEERFRNLMEQSPLDIVILTPEGRISQVNAAWMRNWGFDEDEKAKVLAAYNMRTDKQFEALGFAPLVERAFAGESVVLPPIHYVPSRELDEIGLEDIEAKERWIQIYMYPVKDENGAVEYVVCINGDITERKRVEDALRVNEKRLSLIYESVAEVLFYISVEPDDCFRFVSVNPAFLKVTGLTEDQIVGKRIEQVIPENSIQLVMDNYRESIKEHKIVTWEETSVYPTGEKTGIISIAPVLDENGICTHLVGSVHDITDSKSSQKLLEESEKKYRELVEDINDVIYSVDSEGNLIYISPVVKPLLGYEPHEIVGKHFSELVYTEDLLVMKSGFKASLEGQNAPMDYRITKKDGSHVWISAFSKVIYDDDNNAIGLRGVVSDISKRKESELQVREMARFAELNPAPVLRVNSDGIIISCNPASVEVLGKKAQEGTSLSSLLPALSDVDIKMCTYDDMLLSREVDVGDRSYLFILRGVSNLGLVYIYGSDITKRRQSEQQMSQMRSELLHASRTGTMGELTAALAHELNHPLGSILNNANAARRFLEQDNPNLDEIRNIINDIISEDRRANEVMQKVRNLMKKTEVGFAPVNINTIIEEVIKLTHSEFVIENVRLSDKLAKDLPLVAGERIQLQQVFINLIMNAIDAMKESKMKKLHLSTARHDAENIIISVKDSGTGIDESKKDSLFKPFFTTKKEGMGMGLSVTRTIIKSHGGDIWAENNQGAGACFFIMLPSYKEKSE